MEVKSPRKKISFTDVYHSVSPASTTREIQNDSLSHQDNSDSPNRSSSPKSPPLPTRTMSSMQQPSSTIDTVNVSQPDLAKPIQHRHTESIRKALEKFKSHVPLDGWEYYSENNGVKIHVKTYTGNSTPMMRGDAVISGGFTTYDILSVIINLDTRKLCKLTFLFIIEKIFYFIKNFLFIFLTGDERYEEGATYGRFGLHEHLTRTAMKGTFPIRYVNFLYKKTILISFIYVIYLIKK